MRTLFFALSLTAFWIFLSHPSVPASAEELDIVNRPVNVSGLTGLLFTTTPSTVPAKVVEIGASILSENSTKPDYSITEFPLSITAGIGNNKEIAVRGSYFNIKEGPTTTAQVDRRTGDLQVSYKWNFMPQAEYSAVPGVAVLFSAALPMDDKTDLKMNSAVHWSLRTGLSTGSEISWKEYIFGIYADAQLAGQDISENRLRDMYGIFDAGLLFPISKYRNLQMFLEYTIVTGMDRIPLDGGDYRAQTYGLRLVSELFNLTLGTQFIHKNSDIYDNSSKLIGLMSYKL